jgi:uncharacterized membrane protein
MWQLNGLPLHTLVVHATVVLTPLAALVALVYVAWPRYRDWLRWPAAVAAVVAVALVWAAYLSGNNFFSSGHFDQFSQKIQDRIATHQSYARTLRWITSGFGIVTLGAAWLHSRTGVLRVVVGLLVAVGAVLTLIWVALTGEAGARAVWGS